MEMNPSPSRISLRDIAKRLGVSHVTVSLALRDNPRISLAMREKIKAVAEDMSYRPDPMLAALAYYRKSKTEQVISSSIAWINAWDDPTSLRRHREFDLYWKGASFAAEKYGYRLEELHMNEEITPERLHQILTARGIRGILIPPHDNHTEWLDFPWEKYSVVRFGRSQTKPRSHLVTADQVENSLMAFHKIRERGYARVGLVTDTNDSFERGRFFEAGFLFAQCSVPESERVPVCHFSDDTPKEHLREWIVRHKPDAIFTDHAHLYGLLPELGFEVPRDIALAVTTIADGQADAGINQNGLEIGRVAMSLLNNLINERIMGLPLIFQQVLIAGEWVDGSSLPDRKGI